MTKVRSYIESHERFLYTGTIWGDDTDPLTQAEALQALELVGDLDADLISHPVYNRGHGYYIQSGDLWFIHHGFVCEKILIPAD